VFLLVENRLKSTANVDKFMPCYLKMKYYAQKDVTVGQSVSFVLLYWVGFGRVGRMDENRRTDNELLISFHRTVLTWV